MGVFGIHGGASPSLWAKSMADETRKSASRSAQKINDVKSTVRMLEDNLAKALMINEALWEFIKEHHHLTDEALHEKLYLIDMRDGQLDGKNQRSLPTECPQCHRMVSPRHPACIYCGQIINDSVFDMT